MSGSTFEESTETLPSWEELKDFSGQEERVLGSPEGADVHIGEPGRRRGDGTLS